MIFMQTDGDILLIKALFICTLSDFTSRMGYSSLVSGWLGHLFVLWSSCGQGLIQLSRFSEGHVVLFRIALAILEINSAALLNAEDSMEVFQIMQTLPKQAIDCNELLDVSGVSVHAQPTFVMLRFAFFSCIDSAVFFQTGSIRSHEIGHGHHG